MASMAETEYADRGDPTDFLSGVNAAHKKAAMDHAALEALLTDKEKDALVEFRKIMKDEPCVSRDTASLIKFLRARNFDLKKTEKMLRDTCEWRRKHIPEGGLPMDPKKLPQAVQDELSKGRMFYAKDNFDVEGRQIFVCRSYLFEKGLDLDVCLQALVYMTETARKRKRHPLEKVVCIWDSTNFSYMSQYDSGYFQQFNSTLADNFPESLYATIIYPIGWMFWGIYKVVALFLAEETKKKLCFLAAGEENKMLSYMCHEDLLKELGGSVDLNIPESRQVIEGGAYPMLAEDHVAEALEKKKAYLASIDLEGVPDAFKQWALKTEK
eukprot:g4616.t1